MAETGDPQTWRFKRDKDQLLLSNFDIERSNKEVPSLLNTVVDYVVKNKLKTRDPLPPEIQERIFINREEYHEGVFHIVDSTDPLITNVVIHGPPDTPYENGYFTFEIKSPKEYPDNPTSVKVKTKLYHPFMELDREIWFFPKRDVLEHKGGSWSASITLRDIIFAIWRCFKKYKQFPKHWRTDAPNPAPAALNILHRNPEEFEATARTWTRDHAK